jgi:DNA polymerase-3 subunit delta'
VNTAFAPWQQRIFDQVSTALDAGRLGHALLFTGPAGLGKRAVVERLAQQALCTARAPGEAPCGECRGCRLYLSRSQRDPLEERPDKSLAHPNGHPAHPDAIFVGYAWRQTPSPARQLTQITVEQIRGLSERLGKTPQYGGAQVAVIEPVDAMNEAAGNALLKTLEEPVAGRYLWLVTAHPNRLPATIRSRCQTFEFRLPPRAESLGWLQQQGHPPGLAAEALDAARGHPGLAHAWLSGGELELRREVGADLAAVATGKLAVVATAQRWVADEHADLRLRFAADLAVEAAANGLTDPLRARSLAAWFDRANRARDLLRTTARADLVVVELLLAWRAAEPKHAPTRQGIDT